MKTLIALAILLTPALFAAGTLDIYVIDTEGGKAVIYVFPGGETMLVDAGNPRPDDRDTNRIVAAAQAIGIKQFDYIMATHYDSDHAGNIPKVDAKIPARAFVDHGVLIPTAGEPDKTRFFPPYVANIGDRKRLSVKPGDTIPLKDVKITVLTAGGEVLSKPGAKPNNLCANTEKPTYTDTDDNAGSIGILLEYGKFRLADFADLLAAVEYQLMCPANPVGTVDLFLASHHGLRMSNSKVLVHGLSPKVSIMNNGPRKGGDPDVFDTLKSSPGFQDLWQLHFSPNAKDKNSPENLVANMDQNCEGKLIKVSAQSDGSFTVTNTRNNYSKTYKP